MSYLEGTLLSRRGQPTQMHALAHPSKRQPTTLLLIDASYIYSCLLLSLLPTFAAPAVSAFSSVSPALALGAAVRRETVAHGQGGGGQAV